MEKSVLILVLTVLLGVDASGQPEFDNKLKSLYRNTVPALRPDQVKALCELNPGVIILDTRQWEEYSVSHLPRARFVDYKKHSFNDFKTIPKNVPVVVYCSVGYRSERVGEELQRLGYRQVYNLYGGIFEWKNRGFDVVNNHNQPTDSVHTYNRSWSQWLTRGVKVY